MIILQYFDWTGNRKDLTEWIDKIRAACEEKGIEFMGLLGPVNQKWNYAAWFQTKSFDLFREMARKVPRPVCMTHYIHEILLKITTS